MKTVSAIKEPVKADHLSQRYAMVHTQAIITQLEENGFYLSDSGQRRTQKRNPNSAFHFARMRHENFREKNGTHPEILITNSHDGTSAVRFYTGLFRYVCANGLVIGKFFQPISVRHTADAEGQALSAAKEAIFNAMESARRIEVFRSRVLSPIEQNQFVDQVSKKFYDGRMGRAILEARRQEDASDDLWAVFNRAQENIVKGGVRGVTVDGKPFTSRRIRGASSGITINRELWDLAESFL